MNVIKLQPYGFCFGVKNAVKFSEEILENSKETIYFFSELVHNKNVVKALKDKGAIFLEGTDDEKLLKLEKLRNISLVLSAHGSNKKIYDIAKKNDIRLIDTTCKYVLKTMEIIKKHLEVGFFIIYIGHKNHQEALANKSLDEEKIIIVENSDDIDNLNINQSEILVVCQTTITKTKFELLSKLILDKYINAKILDLRCLSTIRHQDSIQLIDNDIDGIVVVTDVNSNNGQQLANLAADKIGADNVLKVSNTKQIDNVFLQQHKKLAVTSSSSMPDKITEEVYNFISNYQNISN